MKSADYKSLIIIFSTLFSSTAFANSEVKSAEVSLAISFSDYATALSKPETFDSGFLSGGGSITFSGGNLNIGSGLFDRVTQVRPSYNLPISGGSVILVGGENSGLLLPIAAYSLFPSTNLPITLSSIQLVSSVPEPSTYAMMLSGLILVGIRSIIKIH